MGDSSISERVRFLIRDAVQLSLEEIKPDSSLIEDLDVDQYIFLDIVVDIEEEFQISLPDEDVNEITMQKVSDLVKYIEEHVK